MPARTRRRAAGGPRAREARRPRRPSASCSRWSSVRSAARGARPRRRGRRGPRARARSVEAENPSATWGCPTILTPSDAMPRMTRYASGCDQGIPGARFSLAEGRPRARSRIPAIERLRDLSGGALTSRKERSPRASPARARRSAGQRLVDRLSPAPADLTSIRRRGRVALKDHLREWPHFARAVEQVVAA